MPKTKETEQKRSHVQEELPDSIEGPILIGSKTGFEILKLARQYNALPVGDPKRRKIYEKMKDKTNYERDWD